MAFTKFKAEVVARVITDPILRDVSVRDNTVQVCSFKAAVERAGAKKDERGYYPSDIFEVSVWNRGNFKAAEYAMRSVKKGERVDFEADSIKADTFTRKDGTTGVSIKLRAIPDSIISFASRGVEQASAGVADEVDPLAAEAASRTAPGSNYEAALDELEPDTSNQPVDDLDLEFP